MSSKHRFLATALGSMDFATIASMLAKRPHRDGEQVIALAEGATDKDKEVISIVGGQSRPTTKLDWREVKNLIAAQEKRERRNNRRSR